MRCIIGFCMNSIYCIASKGQAQTASIPRKIGFAIITIRNRGIGAHITPRTAANNSFRTFCRTRRIGLPISGISSVPIGTPFPNITAHIIKMQFVRSLRFNRMCGFRSIIIMPSNSIEVISPAVQIFLCLFTAPSRIFPLRFCGQTESLACQFVQFSNKRLAVIPRNHFHRTL